MLVNFLQYIKIHGVSIRLKQLINIVFIRSVVLFPEGQLLTNVKLLYRLNPFQRIACRCTKFNIYVDTH
jgi:hypothetical protein